MEVVEGERKEKKNTHPKTWRERGPPDPCSTHSKLTSARTERSLSGLDAGEAGGCQRGKKSSGRISSYFKSLDGCLGVGVGG